MTDVSTLTRNRPEQLLDAADELLNLASRAPLAERLPYLATARDALRRAAQLRGTNVRRHHSLSLWLGDLSPRQVA